VTFRFWTRRYSCHVAPIFASRPVLVCLQICGARWSTLVWCFPPAVLHCGLARRCSSTRSMHTHWTKCCRGIQLGAAVFRWACYRQPICEMLSRAISLVHWALGVVTGWGLGLAALLLGESPIHVLWVLGGSHLIRLAVHVRS